MCHRSVFYLINSNSSSAFLLFISHFESCFSLFCILLLSLIYFIHIFPPPDSWFITSPLLHYFMSAVILFCLLILNHCTWPSFPSNCHLLLLNSPLFVPLAPTFLLSFSWAEQHISRNTYASTKHHIPFFPELLTTGAINMTQFYVPSLSASNCTHI